MNRKRFGLGEFRYPLCVQANFSDVAAGNRNDIQLYDSTDTDKLLATISRNADMAHFITSLVLMAVITMGCSTNKKSLDTYDNQTVDQLIAMESNYRIDSLVLAFEQAIQQKPTEKLSQVETDILAVEAMEREVNNGGFHQFFVNSSKEYAAILPSSLDRIGCPIASNIASDALTCLKINGDVTVAKIDTTMSDPGWSAVSDLALIDGRYFQNREQIADRLFAYIKAKKHDISIR